jgi:hypothetical protein
MQPAKDGRLKSTNCAAERTPCEDSARQPHSIFAVLALLMSGAAHATARRHYNDKGNMAGLKCKQ